MTVNGFDRPEDLDEEEKKNWNEIAESTGRWRGGNYSRIVAHTNMRVESMNEKRLKSRILAIESKEKMRALIEVLIVKKQYPELLKYALKHFTHRSFLRK